MSSMIIDPQNFKAIRYAGDKKLNILGLQGLLSRSKVRLLYRDMKVGTPKWFKFFATSASSRRVL